MSNPIVGQDFQLNMVTTEDLIGATVTLKYIKPDGVCKSEIPPTSIDIDTGTITYDIPAADADVPGLWRFNADITFLSGKKTTSNPSTEITYDDDIC